MDAAPYYVRREDAIDGPFPLDRIQSWIDEGRVLASTLLSADRRTWVEAGDVYGLRFFSGAAEGVAPSPELRAPESTYQASHIRAPRSGHRSTRRAVGAEAVAGLPLACGVAVLVALALPFARILGMVSVSGYEIGDAPLFGIAAGLAALTALLAKTGIVGRGVLWVTLVCFYLLLAFYAIDGLRLTGTQGPASLVSPGVGLYLGALASAAGIVLTHAALRASRGR